MLSSSVGFGKFLSGTQRRRVYGLENRRQLLADLRARSNTILFVQSDKFLKDLVRDLPASLEFVPRGKFGFVTAGIVCRRAELPATAYAKLSR